MVALDRPVREAAVTHVPVPPSRSLERTQRANPRGGRGHWLLLLSLVVLAAVLRLWGLGAHWLNFDESFTAMAGRKPLGALFQYLRVRDSHPPLDYLLHAPLARAGVSPFLFRLPSAVCSIGAVALLGWWMRRRGLAGIVATALLAVSAFQLVHGREARMYAELELLGVGIAFLAESWLRRPRAWHAPTVGALVLLGLFTHVSMVLLGAGLVALAGRRNDREAWRWRGAIAVAAGVWAVVWGPSFLVQARGHHSDWIPRTTVSGAVHTFGQLVTSDPRLHLLALVAVCAGAVLMWRADGRLGRVWVCCVLVPAALAAFMGLFAPVLLDRALTLMSWGPLAALAFLVARAARASRLLGALAAAALACTLVPSGVNVVTAGSMPDQILRHVEQAARPGDVIAMHPSGRLFELVWSVGVRGDEPYRSVGVSGIGHSAAIQLGPARRSGRVWLLDWTRAHLRAVPTRRCGRDWSRGGAHLYCLERPLAARRRSRPTVVPSVRSTASAVT